MRGAILAILGAVALAAAAGGCRQHAPAAPQERQDTRIQTEIRVCIVTKGATVLSLIRDAGNVDTVGDVVSRNRLRSADDLRIGQILQIKTRVPRPQDPKVVPRGTDP